MCSSDLGDDTVVVGDNTAVIGDNTVDVGDDTVDIGDDTVDIGDDTVAVDDGDTEAVVASHSDASRFTDGVIGGVGPERAAVKSREEYQKECWSLRRKNKKIKTRMEKLEAQVHNLNEVGFHQHTFCIHNLVILIGQIGRGHKIMCWLYEKTKIKW